MLFRDISKDIYTKKKIVLGIALLTEGRKQNNITTADNLAAL